MLFKNLCIASNTDTTESHLKNLEAVKIYIFDLL